jgi:hypothetical protein
VAARKKHMPILTAENVGNFQYVENNVIMSGRINWENGSKMFSIKLAN